MTDRGDVAPPGAFEGSGSGIQVRPTHVDDLDAAISVIEVVAGEGIWVGAELPIDRDARRVRMTATVERDDCLSLVAVTDDGVVCGTLGLVHDGMGHADLGMMLLPEVRGQGVGSALLSAALDWARFRPEIDKVCLQHWPHNAAAHALYRRHGFQVEGYLHRHWRRNDGSLWDAVVMGLLVES